MYVTLQGPAVPVFAVTTRLETYRQLAAVWGVESEHAVDVEVTYEALAQFGRERVLRAGVGAPGASVVVTAGVPFHESGTTNTMRLERL